MLALALLASWVPWTACQTCATGLNGSMKAETCSQLQVEV